MVTPDGQRPRAVVIGPPGAGKSTVGPAPGRPPRGGLARHRRGDRAGPGTQHLRHLRGGGRGLLPRPRADRGGRGRWPASTGCSSLGGGAPMDPETQAALAGHTVVFLDVGIADAARRIGFDGSRPLLMVNPRAQWTKMMNERRSTYERLATLRVDTAGRKPAAVVEEIAARLHGAGGTAMSTTRISVGGDYDVVIGTGLLDELPALVGEGVQRVLVVHPRALADHGRGRPRGPAWPRVSRRMPRRCPTPRRPRPPRSPPSSGASSARPASPARTRSSVVGGGRRPTSPGSSRRPGCAASGSCTCRRRCSPWSTRPWAARPASTRPRARTSWGRSTRPPGCSATSAPSRRCRSTTSWRASPRWSSAASSPTPSSSTSSRPTRRACARSSGAHVRELVERAVQVKADVVAAGPARGVAARGPQLRPHLRARRRAGRALPVPARRCRQHRDGLRRRAGAPRRQDRRRPRGAPPLGADRRSACR